MESATIEASRFGGGVVAMRSMLLSLHAQISFELVNEVRALDLSYRQGPCYAGSNASLAEWFPRIEIGETAGLIVNEAKARDHHVRYAIITGYLQL